MLALGWAGHAGTTSSRPSSCSSTCSMGTNCLGRVTKWSLKTLRSNFSTFWNRDSKRVLSWSCSTLCQRGCTPYSSLCSASSSTTSLLTTRWLTHSRSVCITPLRRLRLLKAKTRAQSHSKKWGRRRLSRLIRTTSSNGTVATPPTSSKETSRTMRAQTRVKLRCW